jgi:hypothetical protein
MNFVANDAAATQSIFSRCYSSAGTMIVRSFYAVRANRRALAITALHPPAEPIC